MIGWLPGGRSHGQDQESWGGSVKYLDRHPSAQCETEPVTVFEIITLMLQA